MVKTTYKPGDKVFAKVKGYPPWPARIVSDTGKKKFNVLFYGTLETGAIKPEDISYYLKYKESYVHKYLKRAGYDDAVKQIEEAIKKDGGDGNDGVSDDSIQDIDMSDASSVSSVSEKKAPKRKVASLPAEEPLAKKPTGKGRSKSIAVSSSRETSEEPTPKRLRRKSGLSSESKDEDDGLLKVKNSSDNGLKEDGPEKKTNVEGKPVAAKDETISVKSEKLESTVEDVTIISEPENKKGDQGEGKNKKTEKTEAVDVKKKDAEATETPTEPEFISIKTCADDTMHMEEEPTEVAEKTTVKSKGKVQIVTEPTLNHNILYAEHVKKHADYFTGIPVEPRKTNKGEVFAVVLPSGAICGVKLHKEWPLVHDNEHDRALYDEKISRSALEIKDLLVNGKKTIDEIEDVEVIPNMSLDDLREISYARDVESKKRRLDRLTIEADLVTWDAKIKSNLGLDKALPDAALQVLKEFRKIEKNIDILMLKKHPHIVDTVRRLQKYVGNVKEWEMTEQDIEVFMKKAEEIRNEAEIIFSKLKTVADIKEEVGSFWDSFMEMVADFRTKCKDLTESAVLVLCAEPDSRQAFLDRLVELSETEGANINTSNTSQPVLKEASVQGWPGKTEKVKT